MRGSKNLKKGFSAIEMLVSVTLFSAVVTVSLGSMLSLVDASEKSRTLKTSMDNLSFAIEDMSRNIKHGSKYYCLNNPSYPVSVASNTASCSYSGSTSDGGTYLAFRDRDGNTSIYRLNNNRIQKKVITGWGSSSDNGSGYSDITAPEINVNRLRFYSSITNFVKGWTTNIQPYVVVAMVGTVGSKTRTQTEFNLMTSLTQRIPRSAL
jgi:prepilin-type N-terminal cleavage/methylation domain-containing protein